MISLSKNGYSEVSLMSRLSSKYPELLKSRFTWWTDSILVFIHL